MILKESKLRNVIRKILLENKRFRNLTVQEVGDVVKFVKYVQAEHRFSPPNKELTVEDAVEKGNFNSLQAQLTDKLLSRKGRNSDIWGMTQYKLFQDEHGESGTTGAFAGDTPVEKWADSNVNHYQMLHSKKDPVSGETYVQHPAYGTKDLGPTWFLINVTNLDDIDDFITGLILGYARREPTKGQYYDFDEMVEYIYYEYPSFAGKVKDLSKNLSAQYDQNHLKQFWDWIYNDVWNYEYGTDITTRTERWVETWLENSFANAFSWYMGKRVPVLVDLYIDKLNKLDDMEELSDITDSGMETFKDMILGDDETSREQGEFVADSMGLDIYPDKLKMPRRKQK